MKKKNIISFDIKKKNNFNINKKNIQSFEIENLGAKFL